MSSLYERLAGVHATRPKIEVHFFMAAVSEQQRGNTNPVGARVTAANVIARWALDATEQTEVTDLIARFPTNVDATQLHNVLLLAEDGKVAPYDNPLTVAQTVRTRLGVPTR